VANTVNSFRNGAVGFIDWLDRLISTTHENRLFYNLPLSTFTLNDIGVKRSLASTDVAEARIMTRSHPSDDLAIVPAGQIRDLSMRALADEPPHLLRVSWRNTMERRILFGSETTTEQCRANKRTCMPGAAHDLTRKR